MYSLASSPGPTVTLKCREGLDLDLGCVCVCVCVCEPMSMCMYVHVHVHVHLRKSALNFDNTSLFVDTHLLIETCIVFTDAAFLPKRHFSITSFQPYLTYTTYIHTRTYACTLTKIP